jgi:hypothetical protein
MSLNSPSLTSIYTKQVESNGNEISLILYGYMLGKLITVSTAQMGLPLPFTDNLSSSWSMYAVHCVPMVIRFQILSTANFVSPTIIVSDAM